MPRVAAPKALQAHPMELPLDSPHLQLVPPPDLHSASTDSHFLMAAPWKRLLPGSFSGKDLIQHSILHPGLFASWQPLTMCFLLHPLINYRGKTHPVFQGSTEEKRKHM